MKRPDGAGTASAARPRKTQIKRPKPGSTPAAKKDKKDDKGVVDFLGNVGSDLRDIAVGSAVGVAKIGQAVASDAAHGRGVAGVAAMLGPQAIITLPARKAAYGDIWEGGRSELDKLAEPIIKGTAESLKKTATDPGYWYDHPVDAASNLLLFTGGVAGGVSRAKGATAAAKSGESVAKALLAPGRETRVVKYIDPATGKVSATAVRGSYSRSAQSRAVQKAADKLRESGAAKGSLRATNRNNKQFGKAAVRNQRIAYDLETVPAAQLQAMDARSFFGKRRISDPQLLAVRAVANKSHPDLYISFLKKEAAKLTKPSQRARVREIRRNIALWEQAKRYVDRLPSDPSIPVLSDKRLQDFAAKTFEVSNKRTQDLIDRGMLDPDRAGFRAAAEARLLRGAEFDNGALVGAEDFAAANPDLVRIPFKWSTRDLVANKIKGMGSGGTVGIQNQMGTLSKSFSGGILKAGGGSARVGKIVAKDAVEAVRWWNSEDFRQMMRDIGSENPAVFPDGTDLVAVRTKRRQLPPDEAAAVKDFIVKNEEKTVLTKAEQQAIAMIEKSEFKHVFPDLPPAPTEGIVWVPRDALGGLERATPAAVESKAARAGLSAFDTINNAQKFAVLYAKLGYIVPNLVGNAALLLIQQGPFAVRSLTTASRLEKSVKPQLLAAVDTLMGEGLFASTFSGVGPKKLSAAAVNAGSKVFGRVTDIPFRRASFFHEAHVRGFKTSKQIEDLLTNPANREKLYEITIEANNDLIDYGRLGPIEKAWIRRIVFFYPWVKGSTRFAGRFVKEHPIQAGVLNQLGNFGTQYQQQVLGDLPTFAQGLVPLTDEQSANPRVIDVNGITPFSTPYETGRSAAELFNGNATGAVSSLTPAAGAINTILNGTNRLGYNPRDQGNVETALNDQYQNIPIKLFIERMLSDSPTSGGLYQRSKNDALLNFLIGGAAPKSADRAKLNSYAKEGR